MGTKGKQLPLALLLSIAVAAIAIAGCGGSDSSSGSGDSTGSGGDGTSAAGAADVAAAEEVLAPYIGKFSPPFLVDEPLKAKPSPSVKISMLQLANPIGGLVTELAAAAAKTAGVNFTAVKAGASASTAQAAAETVITQEPDALILPPFEPSVISNQLTELEQNGTFIVGNGIMDGERFGIQGSLGPKAEYELIGRIFAAWAVSKQGEDTNALIVEHPELSFTPVITRAFEQELAKLCPGCESTSLPIPAEGVSTAASTIVSELQAHPEINQIVGISDFTTGLPAAQKSAGLDVGMFVYPGEPQTFEYVKNGEIEGVLAVGLATQFYTAMDMSLRAAQGMEMTKGEQAGIQPAQILTEGDIDFDPAKGWEPEPNFVETFEKLWKLK